MDAAEQRGHLPESMVWEILTRLPAKSVLRFRVVCQAWRNLISRHEFLEAHHSRQQPLPLIIPLDYTDDGVDYLHRRFYRLVAIDLRDGAVCPVMRFTTDGENVMHAPDDGDIFVFAVHASLNGLLLVSFVHGWYVCNPATRQWAPLPTLYSDEVVGFYAHSPSGEYRVLYQTGTEDPDVDTCYYILTVGSQEARSIGCPISPAAPRDEGVTLGLEGALILPPALVNHNLHWPPQESQYFMMVFDTEAEVFSWMRPPVRNSFMKLVDMKGKLGLSISGLGETRVDLWLLEDYRNQIWILAWRIDLPVVRIWSFGSGQPWWGLSVVSLEGDVLVECPALRRNRGGVLVEWPARLLQFDKNGKLQDKFCFHGFWITATAHLLKASLLPHAIFQAEGDHGAPAPPFFLGL